MIRSGKFPLGFRPRFRLKSNMVVFGRKSLLEKCGLFLTGDILPATHENLPAKRDPRSFDSLAIFGLPLLPLSSSAPTPPRRCWAARPYSHFVFRFGHRRTDISFFICSDFQEALSLLVYRNLWYMDAQVCFLKILFKTWIDHFFQISTEISSDGRSKTLITFRVNNLFDASRVVSVLRLI